MPWEEKPFSPGFFVLNFPLQLLEKLNAKECVRGGFVTVLPHLSLQKFPLLHRFDNSCLVRYTDIGLNPFLF